MYAVIAEPPSEGETQVIKTFVPEFTVFGAAGKLGIIGGSTAPLPVEDAAEVPKPFLACILA